MVRHFKKAWLYFRAAFNSRLITEPGVTEARGLLEAAGISAGKLASCSSNLDDVDSRNSKFVVVEILLIYGGLFGILFSLSLSTICAILAILAILLHVAVTARGARTRAREYSVRHALKGIETIASLTESPPSMPAKGRARDVKRHGRKMREFNATMHSRRKSLYTHASKLATSRARLAGAPRSTASGDRFAAQSKVLVWCADRPGARVALAAEVIAALLDDLTADFCEERRTPRIVPWLSTISRQLPELSPNRWNDFSAALSAIVRQPAFWTAVVAALIGAIAKSFTG